MFLLRKQILGLTKTKVLLVEAHVVLGKTNDSFRKPMFCLTQAMFCIENLCAV